jgi:hypothetical protein
MKNLKVENNEWINKNDLLSALKAKPMNFSNFL